jgi:TadE-like protein
VGRSGQRGQSTVEFGASAMVLILLLFGLIDLGRVFFFDVGLQGAVREGARAASWFDPATGLNPDLYDTDGWSGQPCGDTNPHPGIKESVDCNLSKSGLPASVLANPTQTCPTTVDGNVAYNPPYTDDTYPTSTNAPVLFICYNNTPGTDLTSAPLDNSLKGTDVNVVLVMSFGFVSGLLQGVFGSSIHIVANTHMAVGGYSDG